MEEIEKAALSLPENQRAFLAESLLRSLATNEEIWSEAQELSEVERRERQIQKGEIQPLSEDEFWKRVG